MVLGGTGVLARRLRARPWCWPSPRRCRAAPGAWNNGIQQYQDACYTDIYPLYYTEGLAAGKVPYIGHPVEYPVLIGGGHAGRGLAGPADGNPVIRGREFFDLTVVLLTVFALVGVLATALAAGPDAPLDRAERRAVSRADPVRVHQLGPDRDGA